MKNQVANETARFGELDVLRGLAALGVLAFHYTVVYPASFNPSEISLFKFPLGYYGLHLFFMISGFVILMTLEKTSRPLDFIVSRFSRLFPCYWAAILLTFFITQNFWLYPSLLMHVPFKDFCVNFSMLQSWFHCKDVDGVYWTLAVELTFYFLIFMVYLSKGLKYIEIYSLAWLGLMIYGNLPVPKVPGFDFFEYIFSYLLTYGEFFIAGILFYNLKIRGNRWYRHFGLGLCLLVCFKVSGQYEATVFLFFISIFYLFIYGKLTFLIQKPLLFLGTISYSLYLIHSKIGFIIKEWLSVFSLGPFLNFFIPLICSVGLASLITYLIEKPAMKGIRQVYKTFKLESSLKSFHR